MNNEVPLSADSSLEDSSSIDSENESQRKSRNLVNIIGNNTRLDCALIVFNSIDFNVINQLIEETPENLRKLEYDYLVAARDFVRNLQSINEKYDNSPTSEATESV